MDFATATATKRFRVVCTRPRKETWVEITEDDASASAVLRKAGLDVNGYYLLKPTDQTEYQLSESVWNDVDNNGKLHVVPQSDVGTGMDVARLVFRGLAADARRLLQSLNTVGQNARPFGRTSSTYSVENGWQRSGDSWTGFFRANGMRWPGRVRVNSGEPSFFIKNPPIAFIRSSEWSGCFHGAGDGWYAVNVYGDEFDVDSGIAAINKVLHVAFRPGQRRAS